MYTLRRPLIVSAIADYTTGALGADDDVRIADLLGVPWTLHALESVSLLPAGPWVGTPRESLRSGALLIKRFVPHDRVILFGREVCDAFDFVLSPLGSMHDGRGWFYLPTDWDDAEAAGAALRRFLA